MNVVFDLGAVLFRFEPAELVARLWPERAPDLDAARHLARSVFGDAWLEFDRGSVNAGQVAANVAAAVGLDEPRMHRLVQEVGEMLVPMPQTVALLPRLQARGHRLLYLSNMPEPYIGALHRRGGVLAHFEGGVFSSAVGRVKPDPAIFHEVERRFGVDASHTLFIDDSPRNVAGALAVGWAAFGFVDAAQCEAELRARELL